MIPNDTQLPFSEAIDYLADKISIDTDSWLDGAGTVQQVAFTVAGTKGNLLQEIRNAVDDAINNGISIADFTKRFDTIADSYVDNWQLKGDRAWRSQLIYDQNLRQAYGAGRYRQLTEPETLKRRPFWQYRHGDSRVPRPTHLAMDGKVFPAGSLKCHVPAGFNCRCQIFSLSQRDVDREGLTVEDVSDFEADKGFNYLPGKLTKERRDELLKNLDPDIRKLVLGDTEAEFKLPEGATRRRNGTNYVLRNSRWHRADNQDHQPKSRAERASDIYDLTQQFEHEMEHGTATYDSIAEKFLHDLIQLGDRDRAEAAAGKIDMSGAADEQKTRLNAIDFYQLIDRDMGIVKIHADATRAYAQQDTNEIAIPDNLSTKDRRTIQYHEMAHFTEYHNPQLAVDAKTFVYQRRTGDLVKLNEITKSSYRDDEVAYPDKFIDPYVGKVYPTFSTEVLSMGLQNFADPELLADFYHKDKEHFNFIMRYIRGAS